MFNLKSMSRENRLLYLGLAVCVFLLEVGIALGMIGGPVVRGSLGDVLVIVLVYLIIRASFAWSPKPSVIAAVALGYIVEALQFLHFADALGLRKGSVLHIALGNTFSLGDLLMYLIGGALALYLDRALLIPRVLRP
jgi:hypothetical protein